MTDENPAAQQPPVPPPLTLNGLRLVVMFAVSRVVADERLLEDQAAHWRAMLACHEASGSPPEQRTDLEAAIGVLEKCIPEVRRLQALRSSMQ